MMLLQRLLKTAAKKFILLLPEFEGRSHTLSVLQLCGECVRDIQVVLVNSNIVEIYHVRVMLVRNLHPRGLSVTQQKSGNAGYRSVGRLRATSWWKTRKFLTKDEMMKTLSAQISESWTILCSGVEGSESSEPVKDTHLLLQPLDFGCSVNLPTHCFTAG